jgi:CSLREA domain-containing protein
MHRLTSTFSIRNSVLLILVILFSLMLMRTGSTEASNPARTSSPPSQPSQESVTVHASQRGRPWINLQDGHEPQVVYQGTGSAMLSAPAGANSSAHPTSLASADFNGDGFPDLIVGYSANGVGALSLYRANPEAFAPSTIESQRAISELRYPAPFLAETSTLETPVAPDFIGVGDFNGDGQQDVVIGARGGNALGLLAGDGHGDFKRLATMELPGTVTTLMADRGALWKNSSDLAVGIQGTEGPQLLVYSGAKGAWRTAPEVYSLPSQATGLAGGVIGNGRTPDIVAAAGNQLLIVHRADDEGRASRIERVGLSFNAQAAQVGQFVWDREGLQEIALLSTDGSVHLMTQGALDRRPFAPEEIRLMRQNRPQHDADTQAQQRFQALRASLVQRPDSSSKWLDAETLDVGALPASQGGSSSQFMTASLSGGATDDLLVVDQYNSQVRAVLGVQSQTLSDMEKSAVRPAIVDERPDSVALDVEGAPVAVLPMKLNLGTRTGMVILREGATAPSFVISPAAVTINVTTTADVIANNGQCSLREAIINSNQNNQSGSTDCAAGSPPSQINVPAGTYTLALSSGPFNGGANAGKTYDDEFLFGNGFLERGGDLDIGNFDRTFVGTGNPVIQAGTTAATTPSNGNGIDRVFDVNGSDGSGAIITGAPVSVSFSGLTISNGKAPEDDPDNNPGTINSFFEAGGGIQFDASDQNGNPVASAKTLTLTNCAVTNNLSASLGGGIFAFGSSSVAALTISGGSVSNNTSYHTKGGGMNYDGGSAATPTRTLSISNATISGNKSLFNPVTNFPSNAAVGGGILAVGGTGVSISGTSITGNNADLRGGGVDIDNAPNVTITGGSITNNVSKGDGGGLWSSARVVSSNLKSTITLDGVTITGNTAQSTNGNGNGGGIYNHFGDMSVVTTSGTPHIDSNIAFLNGGGVYSTWSQNTSDPSAGFTMSGGTIGQTGNGNTARNNGGGFALSVHFSSGSTDPTTLGTVSLSNTTVQANTANSDSAGGGDGGGVYVDSGTLAFSNTVTIDSNVANSGTGDGIRQLLAGGTSTINGGTGTINVNGGDSISISGGTFNSTSGTLNLTGSLSIAGGTFNASGGTQNITGNFSLTSGTFTGSSSPVNLGGNFTFSGGTFTAGTGTFNFNGSGAQTISGGSVPSFNNLTINNANGVSMSNNVTVGAALTLTSGALAVGSNTLTLNGAVTATGGSLTSNANGTVNYNQGSAGQAILAANYGNLTFSNFAKTLPNGGTVRIAGTFTTGAGGGHTVTGSTVEFNGTSAQTLPSGFTTYNNLTLNNAAGVTGFAGLTVNGLLRVQQGTFTSSSTYNNVQIDSGATLAGVNATTINVSGNWTNNGTFTANGNTVNFNGSSAQTIGGSANNNFNNLTINNTAGVTDSGSQTVNGALTLTNGALHDGANTLTLNGAVSFVNGNTFIDTTTGGTVNYNQGSNGQVVAPGTYDTLTFSNFNKTLPNGFTINIPGTFNPGTATGHTITGNTINFNGAGTQTIPAFTYNNLTSSSTGSRTLASSGIIKIAGTFTPGTNTYTITGSTVEYNGAAAQTLPAAFTTYNNLTLNNTAGTTGFAGLTVTGLIEVKAGTFTSSSTYNNVQIDSGATLAATAGSTINVSGSWTNNGGTFTPNTGTVNFNGAATQTIGGTSASTFNNLTDSNSAGLTLGQNETVNGVLALTSSDINTGANTLTMPATGTSTGTFDVIGNVKRTGFVSGGGANTLSFGNPNNQITINSGTVPTDITINLAKQVPTGTFGGNNFGFPNAVQRTYIITPTGGSSINATLRLHYLDSELNGNTEAGLIFRRFKTVPLPVGWSPIIPTAADTTNNWLEKSGVTTFSPWTFNSTAVPTAAPGTVSGRVTDLNGQPLGGVILQLNGNTNDRTITAADGSYTFENVEVNNFYTVTPQRANFSFNPVNRSFSLVADKTDAVFTATPDAAQTSNPLEMDMYFVRQQYLDFLGREPDHQGLLYWTGELDKCGTDALCLNNRRVGIAAAFFIEQEYQQTGSFVYRLYKGALGRQLSFNEFNTDRQQVLGGDNLEGSKTAFADAFVQRAEFMQKYNQATGAEGFVDALLNNIQQTSGADLGDQRATLIARYNSGSDTNQSRALVLKEAIDNASFKNAEYNPSFVLMEYFGYLKRDPEVDGYKFWLNVLNNKEPGNYRGMVCSFITSTEYQVRFSSVVPHSNQECK